MADESPDTPTVWKDTQHERLGPRLEVEREGDQGPTGKTLPEDVDMSGLPDKEEEMLPRDAQQVTKPSSGGEEPDTAGQHGRMAPEAARGIEEERA